MPISKCPECSEDVFVDAETEQDDNVTCDECGAKLVVVGLDPVELDLYEESDGDRSRADDGFGNYDYDDGGF